MDALTTFKASELKLTVESQTQLFLFNEIRAMSLDLINLSYILGASDAKKNLSIEEKEKWSNEVQIFLEKLKNNFKMTYCFLNDIEI